MAYEDLQIRYEGSPLHKTHQTRWGPPVCPNHKTPCPDDIADDEVVRVLEPAVRASLTMGVHSAVPLGRLPRYVWGRPQFVTIDGHERTVVWEAQATNPVQAMHKAYPVTRRRHSRHMPPAVRSVLWPDS